MFTRECARKLFADACKIMILMCVNNLFLQVGDIPFVGNIHVAGVSISLYLVKITLIYLGLIAISGMRLSILTSSKLDKLHSHC